jgi:hypothetical protein
VGVAAAGDDDAMPPAQLIVDLADRHPDDLGVVLFWSRTSNRLWVTVTHRPSGRRARIDATRRTGSTSSGIPFVTRGGA